MGGAASAGIEYTGYVPTVDGGGNVITMDGDVVPAVHALYHCRPYCVPVHQLASSCHQENIAQRLFLSTSEVMRVCLPTTLHTILTTATLPAVQNLR